MPNPTSKTSSLWSRQGARNIAGVTYQVAVSAYLLVLGRAGKLPIISVTPEGMEDVDCVCVGGSSLIIQAKERGDGTGTLTCASVAEVLQRAVPALEVCEQSKFVLVTNAQFGSDLTFTDWSGTVRSANTPDVCNALLLAIADRGRAEKIDLLGRSSLVALERQLEAPVTKLLSAIYGTSPSIASLVYALLLQDLGEIAADQRFKTQQTAVSRQVSDLDALVRHVTETVDVGQLDNAVRNGIVEPLDFTSASSLSAERFLLGIEVAPAHIAANLDILRQSLSTAVDSSLQADGYVVIVGPSGAGKSSLLWRSARNCEWVARKARILRIKPGDVAELLRWTRLQRPSPESPLLLCVDNLGRSSTSGWPDAVEQLRGIPGVVILCAVRREDFSAALVATAPSVIEPQLDLELARSIDRTLQERGIPTLLDPDEAFAQSRQLLMEFLSLLLSGRRMREIVTAQVQDRFSPDRRTEREALRYVCAAHRMGLSTPADALGRLLGSPTDFHQSMSRLKSEHLLTENEQTDWVGLHELRSEIICEVLHSLPPPTEADTYATLFLALSAQQQSDLLGRYGYLSQGQIRPLSISVAELLTQPDTVCGHATRLLDALRECETVRYARDCLRVGRATSDSTGVSIQTRLMLALHIRETGFSMPLHAPEIQALANALPARPPSFVAHTLQRTARERITDLAKKTDSEQAAKWLCALEGYTDLSPEDASQIWSAHMRAEADIRGQILSSLVRLASLDARQIESIAGPVMQRAEETARIHPNGLRLNVHTHVDEGLVVTIDVMVPSSSVDAKKQAVSVAEQVLTACPEAAVAEVVTREPSGEEFTVGLGDKPGYKRIPRRSLQRLTENRPQGEVDAAVKRLLAARFWTERLRLESEIANEADALLTQLPERLLNRHDHPGRRKEWKQRASALGLRELPPPPQHESRQSDDDPTKEALQTIGDTLSGLADRIEAPPTGAWYWAASQLRRAVQPLERARIKSHPTLPSIGEPIPATLIDSVRRAIDLLFALAEEEQSQRFRSRGEAPDWSHVATQIVTKARQRQLDEERSALTALIAEFGTSAQITAIPHESLQTNKLVTDRWVIWLDWRQWNCTSQFLSLPDDLRSKLAFRTSVVAVEKEFALPFLAVQLGVGQLFPLDAETVEHYCQEAQKQSAIAPHLSAWKAACSSLVEASRFSALYWTRPMAWRRQSDIVTAQKFLAQAQESFAALPDHAIREKFNVLCEIVAEELEGRGHSFAALVYSVPTSAPQIALMNQLELLRLAVAECELQFPGKPHLTSNDVLVDSTANTMVSNEVPTYKGLGK